MSKTQNTYFDSSQKNRQINYDLLFPNIYKRETTYDDGYSGDIYGSYKAYVPLRLLDYVDRTYLDGLPQLPEIEFAKFHYNEIGFTKSGYEN